MRLLPVNVGMPRQPEWNRHQVRTAVFKHPVKGMADEVCIGDRYRIGTAASGRIETRK